MYPESLREQPFRLFFPLGALIAVAGVVPWLLYWLASCRFHVAPREARILYDRAFRGFDGRDPLGPWLACSGAAAARGGSAWARVHLLVLQGLERREKVGELALRALLPRARQVRHLLDRRAQQPREGGGGRTASGGHE